MTAAVALIGAFALGFVIGDRRGVKQANAILDANNRALLEAMREDRSGFPSDDPGDETARPTRH
ncbi:hypothetical protein FJ938_20840 [Mesorhizobium sp. B2-4-14]|uniref:hypothetical protein n=1 Tax=Mesorhizobium sp. B2-4-14 TaxID=2589935 RepID=UPI00112743B6|nr:hypothetical protein [Mesorhizobium sp. B2-4-14]TPL01369.1 hypothetical protein FJ938_20840 [Mesorhizobium sp. B2-4-14]